MAREISELEQARARYAPRLPAMFRGGLGGIAVEAGRATTAARDEQAIRERFPHSYGRPRLAFVTAGGPDRSRALSVGVVLSGGQAPGGHNVITGLHDALLRGHPDSRLFGFEGGPRGIFTERYQELTAERIDRFRNTGGFDMIGSGRDKIETDEQLAACCDVSRKLGLDGLVIIGGDDSNTNAAVLAEYFLGQGLDVAVVGVPKTIDGDLKGNGVETSFGFDTATKVYCELIGNICRDARSARKYWHFIRLMGRSASHVTLECALQTRPNLALIGEEVRDRATTLSALVDQVADLVRRRAEVGRNYGVLLLAEGLVEFIPEMRTLIGELNAALAAGTPDHPTADFVEQRDKVAAGLSVASRRVFESLPERIQRQLLMDRDAHGNVKVSQIDTELLLVERVRRRLAEWTRSGSYQGRFQVQGHFFGYEGRCAAPSNFDADYTYGLGHVAAALVAFGSTGYICSLGGLADPPERWTPGGVPLTSMMQLETRRGQPTPVIAKALVDLTGGPFRELQRCRDAWQLDDQFVYPGPIQYFGPGEITDRPTKTLLLEKDDD